MSHIIKVIPAEGSRCNGTKVYIDDKPLDKVTAIRIEGGAGKEWKISIDITATLEIPAHFTVENHTFGPAPKDVHVYISDVKKGDLPPIPDPRPLRQDH